MGTSILFLRANSLWEGVLSVLIPKTLVSDASNLAIPAWYAVISFVQPPVKAAGKKARTTLNLPRKSLSVTLVLGTVELSVKSGAMSPSFRWVLGGCVAWPKRPVASVAPSTMHDSLFTFYPPGGVSSVSYPVSRGKGPIATGHHWWYSEVDVD